MLRVLLFGGLDVFLDSSRVEGFSSRKSTALLAYLILNRGHRLARDTLATDLWQDLPAERSRRALNTEFWRVTKALRAAGVDPARYIESSNESVGFVPREPFWLDVEAFETMLKTISQVPPQDANEAALRQIEETVALYRGDLLESVYDDWCLVHREAMRARRQAALEYLLEAYMARKLWPRALDFGGRLLALDPLMEHIHRAVIRCNYFMGNRPAAVRQYAACVQLLRSELGVDPMEETTRIYETILAVTPRPPDVTAQRAAAPVGRRPRGRRAPLEEVNLAIANLDTARGWLIDVTDQLSEAAQRKPSGEGR